MHVPFSLAVFPWASLQVISGLLLFLFSVHLFFSKHTHQFSYGILLLLVGNFMLSRCLELGSNSGLLLVLGCAAFAHFLSIATDQPRPGFAVAINSLQKLMGLVLALVAVDKILMSAHDCFSV